MLTIKRGDILKHTPTNTYILIKYIEYSRVNIVCYYFRILKKGEGLLVLSNYFTKNSPMYFDLEKVPLLKQKLFV